MPPHVNVEHFLYLFAYGMKKGYLFHIAVTMFSYWKQKKSEILLWF